MNAFRSFALGGAVIALAACGSVANGAAPTTTARPATPTLATCELPRLPVAESGNAETELTGPAVADLQGGPARAGFDLDGGKFVLTPPNAGDEPSVSENQAECAALASGGPNGRTISALASQYGVAAGYGRVSIAPALTAPTSSTTYVARSGLDDNTNPKLPGATTYQQRLAWVVVVKNVLVYHLPAMPIMSGSTTTTTPKTPPGYGYLVFVVDARTGSDALLYTEGQAAPVGYVPAAVSVPAELVSVPWTFVARSPDGYAGQIRATVLPCDGVPNPVSVDNYGAGLAVVVERPVGPSCGTPTQVTLPVRAAEVTADLPAQITHDPLGPVVTVPGATSQPAPPCSTLRISSRPVPACPYGGPGATKGFLYPLFERDDNTTIRVPVDSVFAVGPLHAATGLAALPVVSSDPSVIGVLHESRDNEVHEFRAWRTGHADLFVPARGCKTTSSGGDCSWIVHIVVD